MRLLGAAELLVRLVEHARAFGASAWSPAAWACSAARARSVRLVEPASELGELGLGAGGAGLLGGAGPLVRLVQLARELGQLGLGARLLGLFCRVAGGSLALDEVVLELALALVELAFAGGSRSRSALPRRLRPAGARSRALAARARVSAELALAGGGVIVALGVTGFLLALASASCCSRASAALSRSAHESLHVTLRVGQLQLARRDLVEAGGLTRLQLALALGRAPGAFAASLAHPRRGAAARPRARLRTDVSWRSKSAVSRARSSRSAVSSRRTASRPLPRPPRPRPRRLRLAGPPRPVARRLLVRRPQELDLVVADGRCGERLHELLVRVPRPCSAGRAPARAGRAPPPARPPAARYARRRTPARGATSSPARRAPVPHELNLKRGELGFALGRAPARAHPSDASRGGAAAGSRRAPVGALLEPRGRRPDAPVNPPRRPASLPMK